jgi:DHA1 family multidrug resistance protein-like MFS transporter
MKTRTFFIILMTAFSATLGLGVISPFLPELAGRHGANGFWIGMIFAGFGISRGIIVPFIGKMSDRTGKKIFVASGLLLFAVISLLYPRAHNIYELTLVRLLHGLSAGMIIPVVMAYVGETAEKGREGKTISALIMMFYFGLAAGPLLGGYLGQAHGFDSVFYVMSALGVAAFLTVVFFLPDIRKPAPEAAAQAVSFKVLMHNRHIKAVLLIAVFVTLMLAVFMSFLPSVAMKDRVDVSHIGIIISAGIFLAGLLQIPFGRIADKLDNIGKFLQIGAGSVIGMSALFAVPFCPDFHALLVAGLFVGLGTAVSISALSNLSIGIGKKVGMGSWMGIYNAAFSAGFALTPIAAGIIMDHMGIDSVFYVFGLLAFFAMLLCVYFLHRRFRQRQALNV